MTCADADHVLVGRDRVLVELDAAVDGARGGSRSLMALYGEPGQGKTSVLQALVARRREFGGRAVTMRGRAPDTAIAYAALHSLLVEHSHLLEQAGNASATLLRTVLSNYRPPDSALAMGAAITSWFDCLAPEGPLLVAIDDADLLDEDSLRILNYAASRDRPGRIAVVMSATNQIPLLDRVGVDQLRLQDLAGAEAGQMVAHLRPPSVASERMFRGLGGNPLAINFAAHDLWAGQWADTGDLPLAARLRDYVRDRVSGMPAPARHLVEVAAVTGEVALDHLDALCGSEHVRVGDLLSEAEDVGLLDADVTRMHWRRPWFAEAIRQLCPRGRRERLRFTAHQAPAGGRPRYDATELHGHDAERDHDQRSPLTPAERRVARSLLSGLTARQVAQELIVSEKTVDAHVQSIYRKLGVRSRSQLVVALVGPRSPLDRSVPERSAPDRPAISAGAVGGPRNTGIH